MYSAPASLIMGSKERGKPLAGQNQEQCKPIPDRENATSDLIGVDPSGSGQTQGQRTLEALTVHFVFDYGLSVLPVAGPAGTPPRVARRHGGVCYKVIKFVFQRLRDRPNLPSTDTGDSNDTLLAKSLSACIPGTTPDGTKLWTRAGIYTYLRSDLPAESDSITIGGNPLFGTADVLKNMLIPSEFVTWLLQPPAAGTAPALITTLPPGVVQQSGP